MYSDHPYVTEYHTETDEYEEDYAYENDDDGELDACNDERVWDARTEQFRDRSDVWCSFEDDEE